MRLTSAPAPLSEMSPPSGFAVPNVTLCVPPVICHLTTEPGATVIVVGEKLVPGVVTTAELGVVGAPGFAGLAGVAGGFVAGFASGPSITAPPPPHPTVAESKYEISRIFCIVVLMNVEVCRAKFASSASRGRAAVGRIPMIGGEIHFSEGEVEAERNASSPANFT